MINPRKTIRIITTIIATISLVGAFIAMGIVNTKYFDQINRVEIPTKEEGLSIIGNLYFPKYQMSQIGKPPLIIYFTGFEVQKDWDPRVYYEFCRRGFAVLAFELRGHGEREGRFGIEMYNDSRAIVEYVYAKMEEQVDLSRVAVLGHSSGGLTALSIQDSRINTTVGWATPIRISQSIVDALGKRITIYNPDFFSPASLAVINSLYDQINASNPRNLLLIHHENDPYVEYSQALEIQNKTNCTLFTIKSDTPVEAPILRLAGKPVTHFLFYKSVLVKSINWIETQLDYHPFPPIDESYQFIYYTAANLFVFFLWAWIFTGCMFAIIIGQAWRYSRKQSNINKQIYESKHDQKVQSNVKDPLHDIKWVVTIWVFLLADIILIYTVTSENIHFLYGINLYLIFPPLIVLIIYGILWFRRKTKIHIWPGNLKAFGIGVLLGAGIWLIYFSYTFTFKWVVFYPHSIVRFGEAIIRMLPWVSANTVLMQWFASATEVQIRSTIRTRIILGMIIIEHLLLLILAPQLSYLQLVLVLILVLSFIGGILFATSRTGWLVLGFDLIAFAYIYATAYMYL